MKIAHVTLHVGLGTFRPVKVEDVTQHHMHSEYFFIEEDQAKLINDTKAAGGRVIAVEMCIRDSSSSFQSFTCSFMSLNIFTTLTLAPPGLGPFKEPRAAAMVE